MGGESAGVSAERSSTECVQRVPFGGSEREREGEEEHARDVAEQKEPQHDHEGIFEEAADAGDGGVVHLRAVNLRVGKDEAHARGEQERDDEAGVPVRESMTV